MPGAVPGSVRMTIARNSIIEISIRTIRAGKIKIQNAKSRVRAHGPRPRDGPPRYDRTVNRCVPYCEILLVFLLKVKPSVIRDSEGKRHERTRANGRNAGPRAQPGAYTGSSYILYPSHVTGVTVIGSNDYNSVLAPLVSYAV